ncbi:MAG: hypothetical protein K6G03_06440, partial [Lachnospiraceae bacterium]|nr:hypothetical protein [Lachnospiraceae bacterium]
FRDDSRRAELVGHYVERADKDYGEEEHVPMNVIGEVRMGYERGRRRKQSYQQTKVGRECAAA